MNTKIRFTIRGVKRCKEWILRTNRERCQRIAQYAYQEVKRKIENRWKPFYLRLGDRMVLSPYSLTTKEYIDSVVIGERGNHFFVKVREGENNRTGRSWLYHHRLREFGSHSLQVRGASIWRETKREVGQYLRQPVVIRFSLVK